MKKKHYIAIIVSAIIAGTLLTYKLRFSSHTIYSTPLNIVESLKYFEPTEKVYAYEKLKLTPTELHASPLTHSVVAKAVYKGDTIGIKIEARRFGNMLYFKSIGKESENFLTALAELYDEPDFAKTPMRTKVGSAYWNGEAGFVDWGNMRDSYKLHPKALNGKEAEVILDINIPLQQVVLGDKNNGLSKRRFVSIFSNK